MTPRPDPVRELRTLDHVPGVEPAIVRGFARAASDRLSHGPLTLSVRDALLRRGERLGLRRFDANLVLAALEFRHRDTTPALRLPVKATPPRHPVWSAAAAAVVLQGLIFSGAWWLLA